MLFSTPPIDDRLALRIAELDDLRGRLSDRASSAGPWLGRLRRQWRASSAESSIEIEGFHVPAEERVAITSGTTPTDLTDEDRMALSSYGRAMSHVGVMAEDPSFRWVDRVILDLHFDACHFQPDKDPGRYRRRGIEVTAPEGGPPADVGPPWEDIPELMTEVVEWLDHGDPDLHVVIRAAMAHLHVVSIHPFSDGNGRISRIVQSLVLAREGPLAPEFISIEEYLGKNTSAYSDVLRKTQGGSYQPQRDAGPWVRFCVVAHLEQARERLDAIAETGRRWAVLEGLIGARGWPERLAIALEQSLFEGAERGTYAAEADVSAPTASNDLRRLADAGLLKTRGRGRATRYVASEALLRALRGAPGEA